MKKELFSTNELSELEALEVYGGNTASIMSQRECTNNASFCGSGVEQEKCTNDAKNCGATLMHDC